MPNKSRTLKRLTSQPPSPLDHNYIIQHITQRARAPYRMVSRNEALLLCYVEKSHRCVRWYDRREHPELNDQPQWREVKR